MKDFLSFLTQIPTPPRFPVVLHSQKRCIHQVLGLYFSVRKGLTKKVQHLHLFHLGCFGDMPFCFWFLSCWHTLSLFSVSFVFHTYICFCSFFSDFHPHSYGPFLSCIILSSWSVSSLFMISFMFFTITLFYGLFEKFVVSCFYLRKQTDLGFGRQTSILR